MEFALVQREPWVKETRFGDWFQATNLWSRYVVGEAVSELMRLVSDAPQPPASSPRVLDVGSGSGAAIPLIARHFAPSQIVAIDIDPTMARATRKAAPQLACPSEVLVENAEKLTIASDRFDIVFCHQTLHHVSDQAAALCELYRVLKPGGMLLFAESCRRFIESLPVRLLFRHPRATQKTAEEYVELLDDVGFAVTPRMVSTSIPFWSRADFGLARRFGLERSPNVEPTQVHVVAYRPS